MNPHPVAGAAALFGAGFLVLVLAPAPEAGGVADPLRRVPGVAAEPQAPPAGGGTVSATLWAAHCAGCHGNDTAGGRAVSLFDEAWLKTQTDDQIVASIKNGVPGTEMEPFGQALAEDQIWALVNYIRSQTGRLRPSPPFVANPDGVVLATERQSVRVELLTSDLETPWGLEFLPDGRLLITERPGHLRVWTNDGLSEPIAGTPAVHAVQDGGMLDVIAHPDYAENGWIYLAYTEVLPGFTPPQSARPAQVGTQGAPQGRGRGPQIPAMTVVVRGRINANNEWIDQQFIYRADPSLYTANGAHYGLRFIWDSEGHLFFSIGDRGAIPTAQDLGSPLGKIHRVNDDGSAAKDNPFVGRAGVPPTIWSYGHRNPQGLAWHPITGQLWESEHGPSSADEINVIERGSNYGWGVATKAVQPGMVASAPGMIDPVLYYVPSMAPAGIAFYTGDRYPGWKNTSVFVSGLIGQRLERLETDGGKVVGQEVIFDQFGRVRDIVEGPDGYFYVALQNPTRLEGVPTSASTPGKLIRLLPVQ